MNFVFYRMRCNKFIFDSYFRNINVKVRGDMIYMIHIWSYTYTTCITSASIAQMKSLIKQIRSCTHWKTPCIEILSRRKLTFSAPSIQYRG